VDRAPGGRTIAQETDETAFCTHPHPPIAA
jgi:hypothetical protein